MDYLLYVDDCLIIVMVQVSLDLRCSRISTSFLVAFQRSPIGDDWVQLEVFEGN